MQDDPTGERNIESQLAFGGPDRRGSAARRRVEMGNSRRRVLA
jgi:hypothetical protein